MVALGKFAAEQTSGKIETEKAMHKVLDYCAIHPNATLRYNASWMVTKAHSGASYLSESLSRIRAGSFFYMGGTNEDTNRPNREIMIISTITCNVMSSAAEVECGALFYN